MVDILVPIARRLMVNADLIPPSMRGNLTGVLRNKGDIAEMAYQVGGRDARPKKPLMIVGPDEKTVMLVVGDGVAEAAELEELAYHQLEKAEGEVKKHGRAFDFKSARERRGLPQADQFDPLYREALQRRVADHKRNPFSDPARVPQRPPTTRTVHGT